MDGRTWRGGAGSCATFLAAALAALLALATPAGAQQPAYAPLDQPGPPINIPRAQLESSLTCSGALRNADRQPVLLNPATGVTPEQNYSWNYEKALTALAIPWCAYTAPYSTLGDIQTSGEYLVYNIRKMFAVAGRPIAIIGHSQGGMSLRWPLRFWPDTRRMVDDLIGFAGSNHGTTSSSCDGGCTPGVWQQDDAAKFIAAINSRTETFPALSYTNVYTHNDVVVRPSDNNQNASSALRNGSGAITNIAVQDICPLDPSDHLAIGTSDAVAYALAIDALTNTGPANRSRIPASVCTQPAMPGVSPTDPNTYLQISSSIPGLAAVGTPFNAAGAPVVKEEPALKCYVFARCRGADAPSLLVRVKPRRPRPGKRVRFRIRVLTQQGDNLEPVPGARVAIGRKQARRLTNEAGKVRIRKRPRARKVYRITAVRQGTNPGLARVRARRHR